jgi:hypothetical protein
LNDPPELLEPPVPLLDEGEGHGWYGVLLGVGDAVDDGIAVGPVGIGIGKPVDVGDGLVDDVGDALDKTAQSGLALDDGLLFGDGDTDASAEGIPVGEAEGISFGFGPDPAAANAPTAADATKPVVAVATARDLRFIRRTSRDAGRGLWGTPRLETPNDGVHAISVTTQRSRSPRSQTGREGTNASAVAVRQHDRIRVDRSVPNARRMPRQRCDRDGHAPAAGRAEPRGLVPEPLSANGVFRTIGRPATARAVAHSAADSALIGILRSVRSAKSSLGDRPSVVR